MGPYPDETPVLPAPDMDKALATVGVLCHFIASSTELTEQFRAWVEYHPGDLTAEDVTWYLSYVHDLIAPGCDTPATVDLMPERRPSNGR